MRSAAWLAGIAWVGLAWCAGCTTMEHPTATRTVRSLRQTQEGAVGSRNQIEGTIQLLDELVLTPQIDLRPLFRRLQDEVRKIEVEAARAADAASLFREYAFEYDVTWTRELKDTDDEDLRRLRSRTQATARAHFRKVEKAATVVRTGYWSVLDDLRGILRHLEQDMTAAGVAAIRPLFEETKAEAEGLRSNLDRLIDRLEDAVEALSPSAAGPPSPSSSGT